MRRLDRGDEFRGGEDSESDAQCTPRVSRGERRRARARATRALRPALEQMVREARELEDDESLDDDESSEDDEDAAYRDEVMEFDWGRRITVSQ